MKEGHCHCGLVQYEYSGKPLTCYSCHCTDCQSSSGSAFTLVTVVFESEVKLTHGQLSVNTYTHAGKEGHRYHCAHCGSTLWRSATEMPGIVSISSGTFSDTSWIEPVAHIWVSSSQPWLSFEGGADDSGNDPSNDTSNDSAKVFQKGATAEQLVALQIEQEAV